MVLLDVIARDLARIGSLLVLLVCLFGYSIAISAATFNGVVPYIYKNAGNSINLSSGFRPYTLNHVLFSDYAHKMRAVFVPEGLRASVAPNGQIVFPIGTVLSKAFYYKSKRTNGCGVNSEGAVVVELSYQDNKQLPVVIDAKKNCLIELRLLEKTVAGWVPHVFIWDESTQSLVSSPEGANYRLEGRLNGKKQSFDYWVPSIAQCSSCHQGSRESDELKPLGPNVRRLSVELADPSGKLVNQLEMWKKDLLTRSNKFDMSSLKSRDSAREYLDINCGHCHNPNGLAASSGLFLDDEEASTIRRGICKRPVASVGVADRVDVTFDVLPTEPEKSFLYQRLAARDSAVRMPELGRSLEDTAGLVLINDWIKSLQGSCE